LIYNELISFRKEDRKMPGIIAKAGTPEPVAFKEKGCDTEFAARICGEPKPAGWVCSCGTVNTGKFCYNCGQPQG